MAGESSRASPLEEHFLQRRLAPEEATRFGPSPCPPLLRCPPWSLEGRTSWLGFREDLCAEGGDLGRQVLTSEVAVPSGRWATTSAAPEHTPLGSCGGSVPSARDCRKWCAKDIGAPCLVRRRGQKEAGEKR